ncbi:MAG TPA: hypothetical protein ENN08_06920 [Bacteroidales bacterium]|nr:hypothetical protein [Bacteroidales bacterium]
METGLSLSTSIFESFGAISGFSYVEDIREKYEAFAVSKIQDATLKLRGAQHFIKEMTPGQARHELTLIEPVAPVLKELKYESEVRTNEIFTIHHSIIIKKFAALNRNSLTRLTDLIKENISIED